MPVPPRAFACDVFGTCVDYTGTIAREVRALALSRGWTGVDGGAFARAWRAEYAPAMRRVMDGSDAWQSIDAIHRGALDRVLAAFGLEFELDARAELNRVWHRLDPWPDTVPGLTRLRRLGLLACLSNANASLLVNLSRHGGLPWDLPLSAEFFHAYKPDPRAYAGLIRSLGLAPAEIVMVAAHSYDLVAARTHGLRTAYIRRPREYGDAANPDLDQTLDFDWVVNSMEELADAVAAGSD